MEVKHGYVEAGGSLNSDAFCDEVFKPAPYADVSRAMLSITARIEEVSALDPQAGNALRVLLSEAEILVRTNQKCAAGHEERFAEIFRQDAFSLDGTYACALEDAAAYTHVPGVREALSEIAALPKL